jgi:hypothetical protein
MIKKYTIYSVALGRPSDSPNAPPSQAAQTSLASSPLLHPPLRRTSDRRDGVALLTFRSKLPREGAMATEKATPGAPTTYWGQTPVRGLA